MSDNILLLDPSIGTSNVGDAIIMECVRKELDFIIQDRFTYHLPTHVSSFHWYQVWRNSNAIQQYANCSHKFVCGSNLLMKDMLTHYPQWNINLFNYKPMAGCLLVGVGASAGEKTNGYTRRLYHKLLNSDLYHSVRDERSKDYLESIGLKAINTGCATMWMLTPDFCRQIPTHKASRVVFTLTAAGKPLPSDQDMIDILQRNYDQVYFWVQGDKDLSYIKKFRNIDGINIVPPTKDAYEAILNRGNIDYVGTRLHAGVYAMRHKVRSIIVVIDERAREINKGNNLVCMERDKVSTDLDQLINSEFTTDIRMPLERIAQWKSQFK